MNEKELTKDLYEQLKFTKKNFTLSLKEAKVRRVAYFDKVAEPIEDCNYYEGYMDGLKHALRVIKEG